MMNIPFNKPCLTGKELRYIKDAVNSGKISGDGFFTEKCHKLLEGRFSAKKILLTTSCTDALEMAAILINLCSGDEVIVPSYTFVSTVNAFVLRGAVPVFVDIREDTLNIDENKIEDKITPKTKAIFPVHYAGIGCEMDSIMKIAKKHRLSVIEDAAQGIDAKYKGKYLGTIGDIGAYSFHETKNYICGEGGAIVLNDERFIKRAEIIREKGTNRSQFFRGEIDKYTWIDMGSSYLPSDILAAFLYAQIESMDKIKRKRKAIFEFYYNNLKEFQDKGDLRLPVIPDNCIPNYHMFYLLLPSESKRNKLMGYLKKSGVMAIFHYLPLHSSYMGKRFFQSNTHLAVTEKISGRILRLPFYNNLSIIKQEYIVNKIKKWLRNGGI